MTDAMFELPSQEGADKFVLTRGYAEDKFNKSKYSQLKVA